MKNNVTRLILSKNFPCAMEPDFLERRVNAYYRNRVQNTWGGGHIMRGRVPDKSALLLSSNDYLFLANHPGIVKATSESLLEEGNGLLMSGVFLHAGSAQAKLEKKLAAFMHAEAGVLCQSGWCANTGLIQTIADERTPVYMDMLAHMSLWEGVRSAGATAVMFFHNDPGYLEKQVLKHGPGVIVVDSIYSTNGSICPLREIAEIAGEQGCILVVDESHSLGTHGDQGEGLVASMGLTDRVHFRTASLAKAFAGRAGFLVCSERFSEYFKCESHPAIFSSTLLPYEVAGIDATLDVIRKEGWRRDKLHVNAAYLRLHLDALGYNLNDSQSQIISLESGSEQQTIVLRDALEARGIFGSVFCAPATAKNRALIRFSIHSGLTQFDLDRIVQVCADIRDEVDLANWPSSRRKRSTPSTAHECSDSIMRDLAGVA
ncbi:quorum-sensing autoinducer synthase [Candidatus Methylospira mobilis]|uniref:Quorum-sensing autoinducer synthase n=1 Tax=Candidatus Methylospira mobilis TaxID=1808979 RepID=A0A5Q0BEZ4_9GAMM|nr:alpha-hydroxyketone-type quorum-sensing autoinducer synthase [Candidatus Methylospira mobilis]QFY42400.1 quorum-sensing autoinducer synthase [Candidatus Methylospira mobilis]WNV04496.1 alpha-hydroxyketone-type quorum-sensing autoinducer synthase [Candidatus Methylospira mobilis]